MEANWQVDGVLRYIKKTITLAGDLRPVLIKIQGKPIDTNVNTIIGGINAQFLTQGNFFHYPWPDLKPEYGKWKAKKFPGQSMLRRSNKLFKAAINDGSDGTVQTLTYTSIAYGINSDKIKYAKYHQIGTKKMKKRPFLGITQDQKNLWKQMIADYLKSTVSA